MAMATPATEALRFSKMQGAGNDFVVIDLRDTLNRSPREIAVMRGFVDVAGEFAPAVPGVSMARFLREPRG